jgi:hypothetical protein
VICDVVEKAVGKQASLPCSQRDQIGTTMWAIYQWCWNRYRRATPEDFGGWFTTVTTVTKTQTARAPLHNAQLMATHIYTWIITIVLLVPVVKF